MNSFFKSRRLHMTLLETLIAMSLLGVLLVILFSFFRELSVLSQAAEIKQKESFQMRYVENRLSYVFERIVNERSSGRDFYFYLQPPAPDFSKDPSLVFTFDNGVRNNPYYSGDVLARLYLDFEQKLHLTIWPLRVEKPFLYMHDEILLQGVKQIQFSFYAPPEPVSSSQKQGEGTKNPVAIDKTQGTNTLKPVDRGEEKKTEPQSDAWQSEWLFTHEQMPVLLKIEIIREEEFEDPLEKRKKEKAKKEALEFMFVLPSSYHPVQIPQDPS